MFQRNQVYVPIAPQTVAKQLSKPRVLKHWFVLLYKLACEIEVYRGLRLRSIGI